MVGFVSVFPIPVFRFCESSHKMRKMSTRRKPKKSVGDFSAAVIEISKLLSIFWNHCRDAKTFIDKHNFFWNFESVVEKLKPFLKYRNCYQNTLIKITKRYQNNNTFIKIPKIFDNNIHLWPNLIFSNCPVSKTIFIGILTYTHILFVVRQYKLDQFFIRLIWNGLAY